MASNWSKFSTTAALGVRNGYFEECMNILEPYLPPGDSIMQGAAYSKSGALHAFGMINAGCSSGRSVEGYLWEALGFGVAGMGGKNPKAFDDLKQALFTDSTVAGEAAVYAILLGTAGAASAKGMLTYARETQHEKIIRVLAVGVGFIYYGRQEEADETIQMLLAEKVRSSSLRLMATHRLPSL
jgi:26S proteasome regulatory subunit N2